MWKLSLSHTYDPTRPTRRGPDPNQPTRRVFFWKLAPIRTPHPIRPTRRVLTPDPNHPMTRAFLKICNNWHSLHAWSCLRIVVQSYIHARLQQLGCAVVRAVLRSGFRDTGHWQPFGGQCPRLPLKNETGTNPYYWTVTDPRGGVLTLTDPRVGNKPVYVCSRSNIIHCHWHTYAW